MIEDAPTLQQRTKRSGVVANRTATAHVEDPGHRSKDSHHQVSSGDRQGEHDGYERPDHPDQLQSRLKTGKGAALVGLRDELLDQCIERWLGYRAGHPDSESNDGLEQPSAFKRSQGGEPRYQPQRSNQDLLLAEHTANTRNQ